jgi:hypothetical protein
VGNSEASGSTGASVGVAGSMVASEASGSTSDSFGVAVFMGSTSSSSSFESG